MEGLKPSYLPGKENPSDGLTKSPTEEIALVALRSYWPGRVLRF